MHLLKEQSPKGVRTKCGATLSTTVDTTAWWRDVTCPNCLNLMNPTPEPPRRRLVRRASKKDSTS